MESSEATVPSQPEAQPETNTDLINKANNLIAKGKKELSMGLFDNSCSSFASACENYAKVYGDLGKECLHPYIYYANALLELGRSENGVVDGPTEVELKEKLKQKLGALQSSSLTDKNNAADEIKPEESGNSVQHDKDEENLKSEVKEPEANANDSFTPDVMQDVAAPQRADQKNDIAEGNGNECEDAGEENENDDESNLHYAGVILDLVIQICERDSTDDDTKLCLSDAYLKKAEVFEELDEFETAMHYANKALNVHETVEVPHFRMQAEIWCHKGMIYLNSEKYEEAATSYKNCLNILKKRIEEITSPTCNMEARSVEFEKSEIMELIDELNKRLVDIQMSVDENLKEMLKRAQSEDVITNKIDIQNVTNITSKLKKRPLSPIDEVKLNRKVPKVNTEEDNSSVEKDEMNSSKSSS